jgi:hypothetical protein
MEGTIELFVERKELRGKRSCEEGAMALFIFIREGATGCWLGGRSDERSAVVRKNEDVFMCVGEGAIKV